MDKQYDEVRKFIEVRNKLIDIIEEAELIDDTDRLESQILFYRKQYPKEFKNKKAEDIAEWIYNAPKPEYFKRGL